MNAAGRHHFAVPNAEYRDWRQWRYDDRIIVVLKTPCAPSDSWRLSPEATSAVSTRRTTYEPEDPYVSTALHKQVYHGQHRKFDLPAEEDVLQDVPGLTPGLCEYFCKDEK